MAHDQHPFVTPATLAITKERSVSSCSRERQPSPKFSSGTCHAENQVFSTHGVLLPGACSLEQHQMGFLDLGSSPGLQGAWPTLQKNLWLPRRILRASWSLCFRPTVCPVECWPDAEAESLSSHKAAEVQIDSFPWLLSMHCA